MAHSPRYTAEFKAEAVRLATSGERSILKTAADLGIATDSLRAWIKQATKPGQLQVQPDDLWPPTLSRAVWLQDRWRACYYVEPTTCLRLYTTWCITVYSLS